MASTSDSLPVRHPAMLPPVPDDWITSIDPESEEVFYTHSITGARVRVSLFYVGYFYFYPIGGRSCSNYKEKFIIAFSRFFDKR